MTAKQLHIALAIFTPPLAVVMIPEALGFPLAVNLFLTMVYPPLGIIHALYLIQQQNHLPKAAPAKKYEIVLYTPPAERKETATDDKPVAKPIPPPVVGDDKPVTPPAQPLPIPGLETPSQPIPTTKPIPLLVDGKTTPAPLPTPE